MKINRKFLINKFRDTRYAYDEEIWYIYHGIQHKYGRLYHPYRNDSIHHNINFYREHGLTI